jgi:hypothetical protein
MSVDGINDVTKALGQLIESQIKRSVVTAKVTLLPPGDTLPEGVGVNLYLYRVVESSFARNQPWRGGGSHGPSSRPPLALQLHYLLTPLGKASEATAGSGDVTHTMLGVAMVACTSTRSSTTSTSRASTPTPSCPSISATASNGSR